MNDMSKIVVFGGAGFIGSHLLKSLSRDTNHELVSVDIRPPRFATPGVTYVTHDVRNLGNLDIDGEIETVYNFAAVHTTPGHPTHEYYETNISGATEVTAFARRNNVRNIVFTSSISVYGPSEETKSENTTPKPESAYGWSKWLAEGIHRSWMDESPDRKLIICRPAVIFGHCEGGNFTRMAKLLRQGFFVYPGRKDTIKACFYVEDLVGSLLYAQSLDEKYILFNGAYPDRYTIEQIVKTMKSVAFPQSREYMIPKWFVMMVAKALSPFSALGLGIHPDRVLKLIRSTDVVPDWLSSQQGALQTNALASAIERWTLESNGRFD